MRLPQARGPLSAHVLALLHVEAGRDDPLPSGRTDQADVDVLGDEDFHLALWMLFELHYRGFEDVADHEWDASLIGLRTRLERRFEDELRRRTAGYVSDALRSSTDLVSQITFLTEAVDGPNLPGFLQRDASSEQVVEFMLQRSLYHLKESDPHAFVIPRIDGRAKVALAELQYDEYGAGRPERLHATLFGDALAGCGLDRRYGAYVDRVPGHTLAVNNVMSLFGLSRRLRGAALGHLAAFETTSSVPCRRIAMGIRRVGLPDVVAEYFDEHVEADAVHEQVALRDICGALVDDEPELRDDVIFGAAACLYLDVLAARALLDDWGKDDDTLGSGRVAS